jgi:hypothetical protein
MRGDDCPLAVVKSSQNATRVTEAASCINNVTLAAAYPWELTR